jgi:hypothetical protein
LAWNILDAFGRFLSLKFIRWFFAAITFESHFDGLSELDEVVDLNGQFEVVPLLFQRFKHAVQIVLLRWQQRIVWVRYCEDLREFRFGILYDSLIVHLARTYILNLNRELQRHKQSNRGIWKFIMCLFDCKQSLIGSQSHTL